MSDRHDRPGEASKEPGRVVLRHMVPYKHPASVFGCVNGLERAPNLDKGTKLSSRALLVDEKEVAQGLRVIKN